MRLKPRKLEPKYKQADSDFELLAKKQQEYNDYFLKNHPLYPVEKLHAERAAIDRRWNTTESLVATSSKEIDHQNLNVAFEEVRKREILERVIIKSLFARLYDYYDEMENDYNIGYLSDEKFEFYIEQYKIAIAENKAIKLDCFQQLNFDKIAKTIVQIFKP